VDVKSAILSAVGGGHLDVIRFLLEKGADINDRNTPQGLTSLQIATLNQDLPVVKCLINLSRTNGAFIPTPERASFGRTAYIYAAQHVMKRWLLTHWPCI
jgi:ankyrin repeat protein